MTKSVLIMMMALTWLTTGCSFKRVAVNQLGNALAEGGTTFSSDDDPDLIRAAAPFSLKLMESLLAESPQHAKLLSAASSGFTQFAYAFVQQDADELEDSDLTAAEQLRQRARRLYLRARNYGLRGLDARHKGFEGQLRERPKDAVAQTKVADVALLYWTAVSWAGAISLAKDNPAAIAELPMVEALIDRALELDASYGDGAIHTFLITYEMSRGGAQQEAVGRSRHHFDRAMALTGGQQAGPLVALAEAVSVQLQDVKEFESLLKRALAVDVDARPEWRLANLIAQRRAKWLLGRTDQLFLRTEVPEP